MFWKGDNFKESNQEKKQRPDTKNRRLRAITLQAIEKSLIFLSQYWKNE